MDMIIDYLNYLLRMPPNLSSKWGHFFKFLKNSIQVIFPPLADYCLYHWCIQWLKKKL